jgi:uncharacterized protein YfaA (DUF2138 family)
MCIGAASPAQAAAQCVGAPVQAEQREALEQLLDAIQQAAKKLSDQLSGQSHLLDRASPRPARLLIVSTITAATCSQPIASILLETLISLPPPSC